MPPLLLLRGALGNRGSGASQKFYPTADLIGRNGGSDRVVFNVKGNDYRLDASILFRYGTVVFQRIGTHAQYN